jgi:hypothetical protein
VNWEAIGAVGEVVGALGVVITLAYLASQIRNQNRESRLSAVTELTTQWNGFLASFVEVPDLAEVWTKGIKDFSSLSESETVQFSSQCGRFMRLVSGLRDQHEQGRLDASAWEGIRRTLDDVTRYPGVKTWWPTRSHWYSDDFIAFVSPYVRTAEPARMYKELES